MHLYQYTNDPVYTKTAETPASLNSKLILQNMMSAGRCANAYFTLRADSEIMRYLTHHLMSLRVLCKIRQSDLAALAQLTCLSRLELHMLTTEDSLSQSELDILSSLTGLHALQIHSGSGLSCLRS